jgi:hypothetical protein
MGAISSGEEWLGCKAKYLPSCTPEVTNLRYHLNAKAAADSQGFFSFYMPISADVHIIHYTFLKIKVSNGKCLKLIHLPIAKFLKISPTFHSLIYSAS